MSTGDLESSDLEFYDVSDEESVPNSLERVSIRLFSHENICVFLNKLI